MQNFAFNIKKFLSNKNTVTILGVILGIVVLYFAYNFRVNQAIKPQRMPYALETIQPRTKITDKMIGYADIPPAMIQGKVIQNANLIIDKYSNYNTMIPEGSLFYDGTIVTADDLPDSYLVNVPVGFVPFSLNVDVNTSYGNSIFPGNYIDVYFKAIDDTGKVMVGKLVENIQVLDVKDRNGKHVFENTDEERISNSIIFALPEDMHLLLRKGYFLEENDEIKAELIPVPNTSSYYTEVGAINVSNQYLKTFIELKTAVVPEDQLPEIGEEITKEVEKTE